MLVPEATYPLSSQGASRTDLRAEFLADLLEGLARSPKEIPCKWLYDAYGSHLFERICELPEYYPTRTEIGIMEREAPAMAALLGPGCALAEYGPGSGQKALLLLQHLESPAAYVPVDLSATALAEASARVARAFPALRVVPVYADFTAPFELPLAMSAGRRRVVYFPGSTVGNLHKPEMLAFLRGVARQCGPGGGFLVGVDLPKERSVLERAYDDPRGVTAAFDLNLLARANRELGADFRVDRFRHRAVYDSRAGRVEMHLVSTAPQVVTIAGRVVVFREGETIWTESSYKYDVEEFTALATLAGWRCEETWTDDRAWFGVHYLSLS